MRSSLRPLALAPILILAACSRSERDPAGEAIVRDPHSHARPESVRVTHVALDLTLDFERHVAEGEVRLDLARPDRTAPLVVDASELEIASVEGTDGGERTFTLAPPHEKIASALTIDLAPSDESVTIAYSTSPAAKAMQWLAPSQTAGGESPFLFTQGQAILTRSWIPLQDTPGVRVTYEAAIRAPEGLTPVMSAERLGRGDDGVWRFRMEQPIPSYLIALACGEIEFRAVSERCGVWAEPPLADAARAELEDTEAMIRSAEELFGPYRWGRYDLIILPPSFPFGGMENPTLTFATPTILAGDKSLVGLIAHELAHSWSGNLVTNATWRDFWLNEGFTVYCEQRIMERVFGVDRSEMEKALGRRDLEEELATLEPWQKVMHVDLTGREPDEAFSQVPYEKGALFLRRIEELVGRPAMDRFLRGWFDEHAFQSVTTEAFLEYLDLKLLAKDSKARAALDIDEWMNGTDIPADAPRVESAALALVDAQVSRWRAGTPASELAVEGWVTQQWLRFLDALPENVSSERMAELDRAFGFTRSGNSEIQCAWLIRSIRSGYAAADARLEEFLMTVGRRKFLKPLYTELAKTPAGLERARRLYAKARPRYHSVSTGTLDGILGWEG